MILDSSSEKGISPLIASVILIAFVIAVASIVATFFTEIAEDWGEGLGEEDPIGMVFTDVEIVDVNTTDDNIVVRNTGRSEIQGFVVNIYNGGVLSEELPNVSLGSGQAGNLNLTGTDIEGGLEGAGEVEVSPMGVPDRSDRMDIS